jgi:hypothetical protein
MWYLYAACDVVADDFGAGWFGSIVVEAAASSKPVVTYVDETVMGDLFTWHPILNRRLPADIASTFLSLYRSKYLLSETGRISRIWFEEFFSSTAARRYLLSIVHEALAVENASEHAM